MKYRPQRSPASQRGVALLLVLWACTLLAILLGGYAALARTEGLQARYQFARTQAHYAAEAGLMRALYALQDPRPKQHWAGDGRPYAFSYDRATVVVRAIDESGKVDLNAASPEVLRGLFQAAGLKAAEAQALTGRVLDWRNPIVLEGDAASQRAIYKAGGRDYGPRGGPFASIEELQMVLGMTPALYRQMAPAVTIWAGTTSPDPNTAPPLALAAIPGMTPEQLSQIQAVRQRNAADPRLVLNNGTTHSIRSEATLADGTRAILRATVRLQAGQAQPYMVLRWQEGEAE
ncbi:general secretion pathway protein GspK [Rhodanobacter sp. B2A1Ga4]|uniref:general secretion pathway protein GspK n=1 Tax=Rhodanobacter TaxID=75309 RepID=UPI000D367356|nr:MULTISPECIES: type II secretion system protein GspK [Rhodanobacter]MBQ4854998.1 general secretion pathway protein GspK [Rhodanobacter sp. B2A1Ga4]